jgi:hypothetical protein
MNDLASIYVETNDKGPFAADVWWLLKDITRRTSVSLPRMAIGVHAALKGLRQLARMRGAEDDSVQNARFMRRPTLEP